MSCDVCHSNEPAVCVRCLSHNLVKYRQKVSSFTETNRKYWFAVQDHLQHRLPQTKELSNKVANIRREVAYTKDLVAKGQGEIDGLRDKAARRKEALERARLRVHASRQELTARLKARNKLKRKDWKLIFERIVLQRQRVLKDCISLHRLYPLSSRHKLTTSDACSFEISGLPLPSVFRLRDYKVGHVNHTIGILANLTLLLAQYLGIKLPFEIRLAAPGSAYTTIQTTGPRLCLALLEEKEEEEVSSASFSEALAGLTIDIQYLCKSQGGNVRVDEHDLGRMIHGLLLIPMTTGLYSDSTAYSAAVDKDYRSARDRKSSLWNLSALASKIREDLTTDPFEFIEHQSTSLVSE